MTRPLGRMGNPRRVMALSLTILAAAMTAVLTLAFVGPAAHLEIAGIDKRLGTQEQAALTSMQSTALEAVKRDPEAFVGREVDIEGTVVEISGQRAFWLASSGAKVTIFVVLSESVRELPTEVKKDSSLRIHGTVRRIDLDELSQLHPALSKRNRDFLKTEEVYLLASELTVSTTGSNPSDYWGP